MHNLLIWTAWCVTEFFFFFSETRLFQFKKWQTLEKKMTVFSQSPTSTCRSRQACFYGIAFCICPAWHAYYACLKHNNFICHLTSVSHIFPSYLPCKGHAKKTYAQKNIILPSFTCLLSIHGYCPCQTEALKLDSL